MDFPKISPLRVLVDHRPLFPWLVSGASMQASRMVTRLPFASLTLMVSPSPTEIKTTGPETSTGERLGDALIPRRQCPSPDLRLVWHSLEPNPPPCAKASGVAANQIVVERKNAEILILKEWQDSSA